MNRYESISIRLNISRNFLRLFQSLTQAPSKRWRPSTHPTFQPKGNTPLCSQGPAPSYNATHCRLYSELVQDYLLVPRKKCSNCNKSVNPASKQIALCDSCQNWCHLSCEGIKDARDTKGPTSFVQHAEKLCSCNCVCPVL